MLCSECGKEFKKITSKKYCSISCRNNHRLKIRKDKYKNNFEIREGYKKRQKKYYDSHKSDKEFNNHYNELHRKSEKKLKIEVLTHYSNGIPKCVCCGESLIEFLTIDHIKGGGSKHRNKIGNISFYRWLKKNNYPEGYQVMCYNCNCGRAKNRGICPHKRVDAL